MILTENNFRRAQVALVPTGASGNLTPAELDEI